MTVAAHLSSFYSAAPIILWVEDGVTRDNLGKVWGDPPDIAFFVAGKNDAVRLAVETAQRENVRHVFGVIDRDFGHTNSGAWNQPGVFCFYLPRHEIENYALAAAALAGCSLNNRKRAELDIDTELRRLAARQPVWLSCRRVLTEMRKDTQGDFPTHPKIADVSNVSTAENYIMTSNWFAQLTPRAASWTTGGRISTAITSAESDYDTALGNGNWVAEFSGKEIFRQVRAYVYEPRSASPSHDSDFAKAVGEWQYVNTAVDPDLTKLLAALRGKV